LEHGLASIHSWATSSSSELAEAQRIVAALNLKAGASLSEVVASVAKNYDKSLVLQAVADHELTTITDLWVETDDTGYVFFRTADPFIYQVPSVFHEFGHILARHTGCDALGAIDTNALESVGLGKQILRARARGVSQETSEILAEEVAYILSRMVLRRSTIGHQAAFE
jgi:hypothetical protein